MTAFEDELEVFRTEEEAAQQFFFAYLSVQTLSARDKEVLAHMSRTPLFWKTSHYAMALAAFVALGRIFDQDRKSDHNIDKLIRVTGENPHLFTRAALAQRKMAAGLSREQADAFVVDAHGLTAEDVRNIKKKHVAHWRKVYEERYRDVRHMVFAHKRKQKIAQAALAKTKIDEVKELLGLLASLYRALDQLFLNGRKPDISIETFTLPPKQGSAWSPSERVFFEGHAVLRMVSPRDPDELRNNA
jgi:hypothetical protein